MIREEQLDGAIISLYEAATDPVTWAVALSSLAERLDCVAFNYYFLTDSSEGGVFSAVASHYSENALRQYAEHYGRFDVFTQQASHTAIGCVQSCTEVVTEEHVSKNEFYNDFFLPLGARYMAGTPLFRSGNAMATVGFHRAPTQGPFEPSDIALLQRLSPHLIQASKLLDRFLALQSDVFVVSRALDHVSYGVLVVDEDARVLTLNRAAERVLRDQDGLRTRNGRLETAIGAQNNDLHRLIRRATSPLLASREGGGSIAVERMSGRAALAVLVAPLFLTRQTEEMVRGRERAAILIVTDPAAEQPSEYAELLRQLYGLTPCEARVASAIGRGLTIDQIAVRTGVARETIRSQVKAVFAKTGTHHQVEIASLVAGLPKFPMRKNDNGQVSETD